MAKKGVRIIKNGEPSRFLTGDDVLVTNVSSHTGETVDEALSSVADTLDDHQKEIDKLKSNVKYIYSYGGVGGKGSGGSGGGSQGDSARFFASLSGHQMIADSVNAIVLPGPGKYPIDISVGNSGGQTYYVKTDTADNFNYAKTEALSIEKNSCRYQKIVTLNDNGIIKVVFYDPDGFEIQTIEQRYIVNPHKFDMKFMYVFNNQELEFNSKNEYFIGDSTFNDPFIDLSFKIDVTGVTNISIEYSIGDTDEIEGDDEYMSGQGVKNDFTSTDISQKKDHFRIPLSKLKRKGVRFTDESNTGTYTVTATLNYMVNGVPIDPDVRTFKIILIPGYLYINVRNPQDLLFDTPEEILAAKAESPGGVPEKNLTVGAYTSFYCKVFEGPMRTTPRPYVVYLEVYNCSIVDDQLVPDENMVGEPVEMSVNEQQEMSVPFSIAFGTTGIKMVLFRTTGKKDDIPDTGVPVKKYIYINNATSTISWYPSKKNEQGEEIEIIRHNNFYFKANSGEENTYSKSITGEQTFPTLPSGTSPLELSVTDEPLVLSDPAWEPSSGYDTTILSFGMQFSAVNDDNAVILEVFSPDNDNAAIQMTAKTLFDKDTKKICIPPEENFNMSINSQYHLIQIVRTKIGYVDQTHGKYATYLYIDGRLESNDPSGQNYGSLFVEKIKLHNVNVVYNLINLQFVLIDETTKADYTVDGLIYQYYLAYKEIMQQQTISDAEDIIFKNLKNITFDGVNTIVDFSTVRTIAPKMPIPTLMMEATELPEKLETFKEYLFKGYGNGNSLFGTKTVNLYWCNPEKDDDLNQIEVLNIRDKDNTLYNGIWEVELQGTSTMRNRIKNFSLSVTTSNSNDPNKQIVMSPNYEPNNGSTFLPEKKWTLKADIADSAHANNTAVGKFVNRNCTPFSRNLGLSSDVSKYIKNTLEGFPILMFFKIGEEVYYFGVYNFNMGRDSYYNLGYHSNEDTLNMISNIPEMQSSSLTFSIGTDNLLSDLAIGEVQENHAEFDFHQFDTSMLFTPTDTERDTMFGTDDKIRGGGNAKTTLATFVEKVARAGGYCFSKIGKVGVSSMDEDGDCGIRYDIEEYTDENGNIKYIEKVPDLSYQFHYDGKNKIWNTEPDPELTFDVLGREVRNLLECISIYDDEGGQHDDWNYLDFTSASEYYTICMAFGLVDSILKNMNIKSWDNKKCYIAFYDMDCAFGEDNAGHEDVSYLAATDYWRSPIKNNYVDRVTISYDYWPQGGDKGFDYPSSYLFAIAKYAQPILKMLNITTTSLTNYPQQFWANLRKRGGKLSNAETFMNDYFSSGVSIIPAYLTSLNYQVKYLYYGKKQDKNGNELDEYDFLANQSAFNGTRIEKVKEWLTKRLHFLDIVFNVQCIDTAIGGGCYIPKPMDVLQELGMNPDVTILSDAFTGENGNAALINGLGSPVFITAPKNTPVIIVRGSYNDIYLLPEGTNRIKANAVAKETYIIRGSKEFTAISMIDPFLTTGYRVESDNLENITYGGMTFGPISHNLDIVSTSVKEINLQIETWIGNLNINNTGLNGKALHTLNISKSGFTGTWERLTNLKYLNISSVTNRTGKIDIAQCPLLRGENCIISGTEEKPTTLDILELRNVSGKFTLAHTNIREITIIASLGGDAEFTISGDLMLRKLTLQNFKKIKIEGCPNIEELIIDEADNDDHSKDICESIIINIPDYNPTTGTSRYYLNSFNSNVPGVFDFTKYSKLNTLGLSGADKAINIKIPNQSVSIETFKDNENLEFIDTSGQNSIIELTQESTFENCPCYNMRQSWWSNNSNGQDITTLTGTPALPAKTKLTKMKVSASCTSLASTFYKPDSSKNSKYLKPNNGDGTPYTNTWGQKVYNKAFDIMDAKTFLNDYVGGGIIDDAYIREDNIIVDDPASGVQYGENRMANITSLNSCFYKQKDIFYNGANATLPDLSGYENLTDISQMYNGTQISYISSGLLSLYDGRNNNEPDNRLQWSEFIGNRDLKIAKDAFKHISYRISSLSQMNLTICDPETRVILNTDDNAPEESKYLNIVEILCPKTNERGEYITFDRLRAFNTFSVNSEQYIDYTTLFNVCPMVEELNGFLKNDLRKSKIDGMLYNCEHLVRISDSISHTGSIDDLSYMIDLFEFFNWTSPNSYAIRELFSSNSNSSEPSFAVKKIITQENFATIMSVLHNYTQLEQLSNIFSYCLIDNYDPNYEIKLSGDMPRVTNVNCLFYHCRSLADNVPLKIRRSLFQHLPNVTMIENTFNSVWFDHMLSYDFFCKRSLDPRPDDVYVSDNDEAPTSTSTSTNAKLYTVKYNQTINSLYNCFSGAKFYGCKCWFDVNDDYENVEDSNVTLKPYDDYLKYSTGEDCDHTVYYRRENSVWIKHNVSASRAYLDTLNNYTNYSSSINSSIAGWVIDNHNIDKDLITFDPNHSHGYPYDTILMSDIHISPTFCCLPPDIFYGCHFKCDLSNVFEDTNIIGVLPQHLIIDCYESKLNNMFKNVNILPNLIYHYDSKTENDGNYTNILNSIPIDETLINKQNTDTDTIRYNLSSGDATVLFRNSDGELRRRRPIVSAYDNVTSEPIENDYTIKDYSKSIFTYIPQGYANNQNYDYAFTFRYNLPAQVDLSRQSLNNNYGIIWENENGGIEMAPDYRPDMWPYYTQYFFAVDESIVWNKVSQMNNPFITENQDCDWSDLNPTSGFLQPRQFSNASKDYKNKWWPTDYTIEKSAWTNFTSSNTQTKGTFNVFLNLCGSRDIRTGKLTDCGFLIGRAMRNVPKLNSFISGPLVVFLNGRIFDTEVDAGEFTDLNGSSQAVQYSLGLSRNIIFPVYHMTSTNLDLASRFILTWSGTERTVFYDYMFPHDSLDNYHTIFGVRDCMLNTPKYKVY